MARPRWWCQKLSKWFVDLPSRKSVFNGKLFDCTFLYHSDYREWNATVMQETHWNELATDLASRYFSLRKIPVLQSSEKHSFSLRKERKRSRSVMNTTLCYKSHVQLFATSRTVAYQASPSIGFSRQEYWSGLPLVGWLCARYGTSPLMYVSS